MMQEDLLIKQKLITEIWKIEQKIEWKIWKEKVLVMTNIFIKPIEWKDMEKNNNESMIFNEMNDTDSFKTNKNQQSSFEIDKKKK